MHALLHAYHAGGGSLIAFDVDYADRLATILCEKDVSEHAIRIRHLQQLSREAVDDLSEATRVVVAECDKARAEFAKARAEYDKAKAEYFRVGAEHDKAKAEYFRAWAEYDKAWAEYDKAWAKYDKAKHCAECIPELRAWHDRWCHAHRDGVCQWDGKRIVGIGE